MLHRHAFARGGIVLIALLASGLFSPAALAQAPAVTAPEAYQRDAPSNPHATAHNFSLVDLQAVPLPLIIPILNGPPYQQGYPLAFGQMGTGTCDVDNVEGGALNERNFGGSELQTFEVGDLTLTVNAVGLAPFSGADCGPDVGDVIAILYQGPLGHDPAAPCNNHIASSFDTAPTFPANLNAGDNWTFFGLPAGSYTLVLQNLCDTFPASSSGPIDLTLDLNTDADLELEKAAEIDEDGNAGSYHITLTNAGPGDATDIVVQDDLPPGLVITNWSTTQGAFDPFAGSWDVGTLPVGAAASLRIDAAFGGIGEVVNCAEVAAAGKDDPDSIPGDGEGDDHDCASFVRVGERQAPDFVSGRGPGRVIERGGRRFRADLSLTKTVDEAAPEPGDAIEYTLVVTNLGPLNTAGVEVMDHLPDCLELVGSDTRQGAYDGWTWDVDKLKVGESATLKIIATVTAACTGEVVNVAEATSNLPDPDDDFFMFDDPPIQDEEAAATFTVTAPAAKAAAARLLAAYPNPFNPETVIPFELSEPAQVTVAVYDLLGRQVQVLAEGRRAAGVHEVFFHAGLLPTGLYLVRLTAGGAIHTRRITLMK